MKKKEVTGKVYFEEQQKFRQTWLWIILAAPIFIVLLITTFAVKMDDSERQEALLALAIVVPVQLIMLYFFYTTRFEKAVTDQGFYYRWLPFQKNYQFIPREEIRDTDVRSNPSMSIGYKIIPGYGRSHTVAFGKGVEFDLKDKKLFVGTDDVFLFRKAIDKLLKKEQL